MSNDPIFLAAKDRTTAKRLLQGAAKGAYLPDSNTVEYPQGEAPVLLDAPGSRTGVLQEELVQNEHGTGRAKVKLHTTDFENSNAEVGIRLKVSEEEVEAYCATLENGDTIASQSVVRLIYVVQNNRWELVTGGGGGGGVYRATMTSTLTQNSSGNASANMRIVATNEVVEVYAWLLKSGETLASGRNVLFSFIDGRYEVVSASCP